MLFWINIVFAGAMILLYLGPYVDPKKIWHFTLLGMGYPYLLAINVFFVLLWTAFKKKYALISVVTILIGISYVDRFFGIDLSKDIEAQHTDLKVMSFNTQDLADVDLYSDEYYDVIRQIQRQDVVFLQEISNYQIYNITRYMVHHNVYKPKGLSLCILSQYPITDQGVVSKENASNGSIWAEIEVDSQRIRVYNVHLQSYRVKKATTDIMDNAEFGNEKTWTNVRSVLSKIRDMSIKRSTQVAKINEHRKGTELPTILGGDFNDTPMSNTYRRLSSGFTDSFSAKGNGVGTTYAGRIPLLRIDYIFVGAPFKVINHDVIESDISDHYPIKSVIRLQPE